ncbi:polysaccharide biosynthesis protein [Breznakia sp. OttesenSCG-928-G09]|nr:polysaccharide biosynthesis protein [Breznakia sp. OttesenSCG-928-G09]
MKKVLFISSTGGHLSELLQLQKIYNQYDYHIITERTKSNKSLEKKFPNRVSFLKYGTKHKLIPYLFVFPYNILKSFYFFIKFHPNVIVTTGAHTCVPICYIAKLFRRRIVYIETFANIDSKTLTGKLIYPIADLFIVQWEEMLALYPKAKYGGWIY